jgi:hypothetical protein
MNSANIAALILFSLAAPLRSEENLVDTLTQDNLQETFRVLLKDYIQPEQLSALEINRAALDGLLGRLGLGVELIPRATESPSYQTNHVTVAEIIEGNIAYLRPSAFSEVDLTKTDEALTKFAESACTTLILDMRSPMPDEDFSRSASFLNRFCPPSETLFKITKPGKTDPPQLFTSESATITWTGETILLVDAETSGAAEIAAAVIHHFHTDSLIVGQQTPGRTVQYQTFDITEATTLRFAIAEAILPDDTSLFQKGLTPKILTVTPPEPKHQIFKASEDSGMAKFVEEKEHPVLNEAALVAGTNPELPYLLDKSAKRESDVDKSPLIDTALQRTLDFLKIRKFLE